MTGQSDTAATCGGTEKDRTLLRVLVLALEFTFHPFSGNGMYGRSVVKSLLRTGQCEVTVICARPHPAALGGGDGGLSPDHPIEAPEVAEEEAARLTLWPVDLPAGAGWRRLDDVSPWAEFAAGAAARYADHAAGWDPEVALVVDWHGGAAWRSLADSWPEITATSSNSAPPPVYYFNFRVYSSGLCTSRAAWYEDKEREALSEASDVVCLSRGDVASLKRLLPPNKADVEVRLLHPALRGDMRDLALTLEQQSNDSISDDSDLRQSLHPAAAAALGEDHGGRSFVTCAVRLSEEKKPLVFVELMEQLRGVMSSLGLIPLLCGAASDKAYASECRERLLKAYPDAVVIQDFLGPKEMAAIFAQTLVNVHPSHYDAYGMTAVEAAAFGAPSIINGGSTVGATELLGEEGSLQVDLARPMNDLAEVVGGMLADKARLAQVRREAYKRAMGWSEDASGKIILGRLSSLANRT